MSKWYEVKVTTSKLIAVEIEDDVSEEEGANVAMAVAMDEAPMSGVSEAEVTGGPYYAGDVLDSLLRHCDEEYTL